MQFTLSFLVTLFNLKVGFLLSIDWCSNLVHYLLVTSFALHLAITTSIAGTKVALTVILLDAVSFMEFSHLKVSFYIISGVYLTIFIHSSNRIRSYTNMSYEGILIFAQQLPYSLNIVYKEGHFEKSSIRLRHINLNGMSSCIWNSICLNTSSMSIFFLNFHHLCRFPIK